MWKNDDRANSNPEISPTQSGWVLDEGKYRILWFEGDQMPKDVPQNALGLCNKNTDEENRIEWERDSDDQTKSKSEVDCSDILK